MACLLRLLNACAVILLEGLSRAGPDACACSPGLTMVFNRNPQVRHRLMGHLVGSSTVAVRSVHLLERILLTTVPMWAAVF